MNKRELSIYKKIGESGKYRNLMKQGKKRKKLKELCHLTRWWVFWCETWRDPDGSKSGKIEKKISWYPKKSQKKLNKYKIIRKSPHPSPNQTWIGASRKCAIDPD